MASSFPQVTLVEEVPKEGVFRIGLVDDDSEADDGGAVGFDELAELGQFAAAAEGVVDQEDLFPGDGRLSGRKRKGPTPSSERSGPVDLFGAEGFTDAIGDREAAGCRGDYGEFAQIARASGWARSLRLRATLSRRAVS